ncbi:MAG: MerR family transcriptional regulator [Chloroflexota bacterium]|nr:MerR family transcriptional regulator [Chloroflexota bacterium]
MSQKHDDLMSIGQFAKASRLSRKALRLYDRKGLLKPHRIDVHTGYRYYDEGQLERARMILLLRSIDMPLDKIKEVLAAPESTSSNLVEHYWGEVESRMHHSRRVVDHIHIILKGEEKRMPYRVDQKELADTVTISICDEVSLTDLIPYIDRSIASLRSFAEEKGLEVTGPPMGIYHGEVNEDSNGPVEICLPFEGEAMPTDVITVRTLKGGPVAYTFTTVEQARFPEILQAYDAVHKWIRQSGHQISESPREIYLASEGDVSQHEPFIEIAWPFR